MGIDNWVKVVIIAVCLINSMYAKGGVARDKRDQMILVLAMAFTLLADSFMLLWHMNAAGVLAFCVVQALHNYRFTNKARLCTQITLGIVTFITVFIFGSGLLISLGAAYGVFLLFSVTGSFMAYRKYPSPNNLMITIGMLLFMACDIFVAVYNTQTGLTPEVRDFVFRGIWFCYLPSQALLSSSARKAKKYEDD